MSTRTSPAGFRTIGGRFRRIGRNLAVYTAAATAFTPLQARAADYIVPGGPTLYGFGLNGQLETASIAGAQNVNKSGTGMLFLTGTNSFAGAGNVSAGTLTLLNDVNFGAIGNVNPVTGTAAPNVINLTAGARLELANVTQTQVGASFFTLSHVINVGTGGGQISVGGPNPFGGDSGGALLSATDGLTGSGTLTKVGLGRLFISSANNATTGFTGVLRVGPNGGQVDVRNNGSLLGAAGIVVEQSSFFNVNNENTLAYFPSTSNLNRLADTIGITLRGGRFMYDARNSAGNISETVGVVRFELGQSEVRAEVSGQGSNLTLSGLDRQTGSTNRFTAEGTIGQSTNNGRIFITGQANNSFLGGWAVVNTGDFANYTTAQGVGNYGGTGFQAYDAGAVAADFTTGKIVSQTADVILGTDGTPANFSVRALRMTGGATRVLNFNNATDTLFIESGGILSDGSNNVRTIGGTGVTPGTFRGQLTAGLETGATGTQELFFHNNSNTMTVNSVIINNSASAPVAVVKDLDSTVTLTAANTYTGGTTVLRGTLTANAANTLGFGSVTVKNSRLNLNAVGAITIPGSGTAGNYTLLDNGEIFLNHLSDMTTVATEQYTVNPGAILIGRLSLSGTAANQSLGMNSLTRVPFLTPGDAGQVILMPDAIVGHNTPINSAENGLFDESLVTPARNTIQALGTDADLFFGLSNDFNAGAAQGVTLGAGTPWKGMSTDRADRNWRRGTITLNGDVIFQGLARENNYARLILGDGTSATNGGLTYTNATAGNIRAFVVGRVDLNENGPVMPSNLTWTVTPGAFLSMAVDNGLGNGTPANNASILIQGGGTVDTAGGGSLNGNVVIEAGGVLNFNDNVAQNGAGTITVRRNGIVHVQNLGPLSGTQPFSVEDRAIVRMAIDNVLSLSRVGPVGGSNASFVVFNGNRIFTSQPTPEDLMLNGGLLTNDSGNDRAASTGFASIVIGANGATFAASNGTRFRVQEDFQLGTNTLTIGFDDGVDGNHKMGTVSFNGNGSSASVGGVINIIPGVTLQFETVDFQIPNNARLNISAGATFDLNNRTDVIGSLTGGGNVISNGGSGTLVVGGDNTNQSFAGNIQSAVGQNPHLYKTGTGRQDLTGVSTSTSNMHINQGTVAFSGGGVGAFNNYQVNRDGTLLLDNAGTAMNNRLGGTGKIVRAGGGTFTLQGHGSTPVSEAIGTFAVDGAGQTTINLNPTAGAGVTLMAGTLGGRSVSTMILRGKSLGAAPGPDVGTFIATTSSLTGGNGTNLFGMFGVPLRPDILSDTPSTGGTGPLSFVTQPNTTSGFRALLPTEYSASVSVGSANLHALYAANAAQTLPGKFDNSTYATINGFETSFSTITVEPGVTSSIIATDGFTVTGARTRLSINGGGLLVRDNGSLTINSTYLDGSNYYVHSYGATGNVTINATILGGTLTKSGPGKLTLGPGALQFTTGNFSINQGSVELGAGNSFFTNTGTATNAQSLFFADGTLDLKGNTTTINSLLSSNSTGLTAGAGGTLTNTSATASNLTVYSNGVRFAGSINGNIHLTKAGPGNMELLGDSNYTGTTTLRGGALLLRENGRLTGTSSFALYNSTLFLDLTYWNNLAPVFNRIRSDSTLTLRGSTLELRGFDANQTAQSVSAVTVELGNNFLNSFAQFNADTDLTIGNLTRTGSTTTVDFRGTNLGRYAPAGTASQEGRIVLTNLNGAAPPTYDPAAPGTASTTAASGFIGAWAVVNEGHFAAYSPAVGTLPTNAVRIGGVTSYGTNYGTGAASPAYVSGTAAASYSATAGNTNIVDVTADFTLPAGDNFVGAMRLSPNATRNLNFNATTPGILNIESGGIVRSNDNNAANIGSTTVRGQLTAGGSAATGTVPLFIHTNQNTFTVNSVIRDNPNGAVISLVKSLGGNLALTATNTYTGMTVINGGRIVAATTAAANGTSVFAIPTDVIVNGGSTQNSALQLNGSGQVRNGINLTFNNGGFLDLPNVNATTNTVGNITVNWDGANQGNFISAVAPPASTTITTTLVINGDITVVNNVPSLTPTIPATATATSLGTANIQLEFSPGAHVLDTTSTSPEVRTGLTLTANIVNSSGVTLNKTGSEMLIFNAPGVSGAGTFAGTLNINGGQVRVDNVTSFATGAHVNVNAGGALIANINGNPLMNITLNGGVLGAVTSTATIGTATHTVAVPAASEIRLHDFFQETTGRQMVINSIVSGSGTLSIAGSVVNAQNNSLTLTNVSNTYSGSITVAPNVNLIAQATGKVGTTLGTANIQMAGGELRIRDNGPAAADTLAYGNNLTLLAGAMANLSVDRVDANTGHTVALGNLTLNNNSVLSGTAGNSYVVTFTGATVPAGATGTINTTFNLSLPALTGSGTLAKSNSSTVTLASDVSTTFTGGLAINGGTIRLINAGNPLAASTPIAIKTSGVLQADPGAATVTLTQNFGNVTGTIHARTGVLDLTGANGGTGIINGAPNFTPNAVSGLREGRISAANNFTIPNPANFGITAYPRMGQINSVTQNPHTGWQDNTTWVYTGQFFDADGMFAFVESIDDSTHIRIDGVVRLSNSTFNGITSTGTTDGRVATGTIGTTTAGNTVAGQNASGGVTNFGMGPAGDGWHDIEIRVGNGTGGAGPVAGMGFTTFYGLGLYDGTDPSRLASTFGTDYLRLDELTAAGRFRTTAIGGTLLADAGAELRAVAFSNMEYLSFNGNGSKITLTGTSQTSNARNLTMTGVAGNIGTLSVAGGQTVAVSSMVGLVTGTTVAKSGAGTLQLQNVASIAGQLGGIDVQEGTLDGTGTLLGPVTVRGSATLSPGQGTGLLNTGALVLDPSSILRMNVNGLGAGTGYDQVNVTGAVTVTDAVLNLFGSFVPPVGTQLVLVNNDGTDPVTGTFFGLGEGATVLSDTGTGYVISYVGGSGNDITLAVPEPGTLSLAGLVAIGLLARRRRRS